MRKPISIKLLQREETNRRISLMMTTLLKKTKKVKKNQIYKLISCLLQLRMIMMNLFSFNPNSNRLDLLVNFHLRSKSPHSIEEALFSHKQKMFSLKFKNQVLLGKTRLCQTIVQMESRQLHSKMIWFQKKNLR